MKMNSKIIALAIVAMFCLTACADIAASDESDGQEKTYRLYIEVIDGKGETTYNKWISANAESTVNGYISAFSNEYNAAVKELKGMGNYDRYYIDNSWNGITFHYDSDMYYATTFYNNDGKWTDITDIVNDYLNASSVAVVLCPVDSYYNFYYLSSLPAGADANNYVKGDYGFMYLPHAGPSGFESPIMMFAIIILAVIIVIVLVIIVVKGKNKNTV